MNASSSLLEPLDKLQTLSHSFFLSLSSSTPSTTAQGISTSAFTSTAQSLAESIALTHKHQTKQRRITALLDEILSLDQTWRTICLELKSGKDELAEMIEEGEERIKGIKDAKEAALPYPELLAYAQSLSTFSSAPPNLPPELMAPGGVSTNLPLPPLIYPPFPNEEKMRRGKLNQEKPLEMLGEMHDIGGGQTRAQSNSPHGQDMPHHYNPMRHQNANMVLDLDLDLNPDL